MHSHQQPCARGLVLSALPRGETDIASRAHGAINERPTPGQASRAGCPHDDVYRVAPAAEQLIDRVRERMSRENPIAGIELVSAQHPERHPQHRERCGDTQSQDYVMDHVLIS